MEAKIAIIIHGMGMGGAEKFTINLLNHLYDKGENPILILLSNENLLLNELNKNIPIFIVLRKYKFDLTISQKIKQILIDHQIKKVFCVNTYAFFLTKIAFQNHSDITFYLSVHSTIPNSFKSYLLNFLYYRFLSKKDYLIFLCKNQQLYLKKTFYLKTSNEFIINNGINTSYFDPSNFDNQVKNKLRFLYNIKDDETVILKVARIQPEKGHFDAIEALHILHNKFKEKSHLFFVGGGSPKYINDLHRHVTKRQLQYYVHIVGNKEDVREFYYMSDLFTLTSYNTETFSLAALEAMAFGLPCSLTDIGGASEMTLHGKTGLLTSPHDPLSIAHSWYILLNSHLKSSLIRQYVVDRFMVSNMLNSYLQLIG